MQNSSIRISNARTNEHQAVELLCKTRPMFQSEHIGDSSSESLRLELDECSGWNIVFSVPVEHIGSMFLSEHIASMFQLEHNTSMFRFAHNSNVFRF